MKIVITGGAGMIGSNLASELLKKGHDIIVIDNLWRGSLANLKDQCGENFNKLMFVNADLSVISDWAEWFKDVDCVYHLADIVAGIGYVFNNETSIFRKNLMINSSVNTVCELMNVKRYVYVGTACSFPLHLQSGVDAKPLKEENQYPANPESAYGWSKLMGELDANYMQKYKGIPSVVLVLHNVYGVPCDFNSNRSQALPAMAYRALNVSKGETLKVWGDGTQGRAFVNVKDVVKALEVALVKGEGVGPIQIGPDFCTPIKEAAEIIVNIIDSSIPIEFDTTRPIGDKGRCANYSKAKKILGWEPTINLNDGLTDMINWIKLKKLSV